MRGEDERRARSGGDDKARDGFAGPRGETTAAVIARALPLPLSMGGRAVRGVIGLDPKANTRVGWRVIESRDRCEDDFASWRRSMSGDGTAGLGAGAGVRRSSRSRSRSRRRRTSPASGGSLSDLQDSLSGVAVVWDRRRLNLVLGEPTGDEMSCRDRAGVRSGCDADPPSG